jgi:alpha(1,3/1,4) fucosyltransferase
LKSPSDVSVFVDPFSYHFYRNQLFDPSSRHNRDDILLPYVYLKERLNGLAIAVHTADFLLCGENVNRTNVYFSLGILNNYLAVMRRGDVILSGFFAVECPNNAPTMYRGLSRAGKHFRRIYSYSDAMSLRRFVGGNLKLKKFLWPQPYDSPLEKYWGNEERQGLVLINANKMPKGRYQELCTERLRALAYFSRHGHIDLYGFGWDRLPYQVGYSRITTRLLDVGLPLYETITKQWQRRYGEIIASSYRGPAASKFETLSRYQFAICFENMILPGWVTEKIFDCFYCGTVPIYLGAPDIEQYIPPECFIDMRRFSTYEALAGFLNSLGKKEIQNYREQAKNYLQSKAFKPFSKETLVQHFIDAIQEDVGL